jgi:hypothetical protein
MLCDRPRTATRFEPTMMCAGFVGSSSICVIARPSNASWPGFAHA